MRTRSPFIVLVGDVCVDVNVVNGVAHRELGSAIAYISRYVRMHVARAAVLPVIASYGFDRPPELDELDLVNGPTCPTTLRYENTVAGGVRTQRCIGAFDQSDPELDGSAAHALAAADIVIVAPLTPVHRREYWTHVLELVPPQAIPLLLPQGLLRSIAEDGRVSRADPGVLDSVVAKFPFVLLSDEDTEDALVDAERWVARATHTTVIVTQNRLGATIVTDRGRTSVPTTPLDDDEVHHPIGAGDTFAAAFAVELARGATAVAAVERANRAARDLIR